MWKTRRVSTAEAYLRGEGERFWTIGLSIMATQASAITFLSTPGQAYEDGLGFLQFYFGLPIAMVLLAWWVVPIYRRLRVYTAYEYLESRFDRKTRVLTAAIFLVSRGLAAGMSLYAPALVLTAVLGWPLQTTNLTMGALAVLYTVSGGTRAVSVTQSWQMGIMLSGMLAAFLFVLHALPAGVGLTGMVKVAGALGKMHAVDVSLRLDTRYTLWSGLIGGLFVALAYFGTDQSQVQRYLGGASLRESRTGLLFNALIKVPMQFLVLMVGIAVVVFHQFERPPLLWNGVAEAQARKVPAIAARLDGLDARLSRIFEEKHAAVQRMLRGDSSAKSAIRAGEEEERAVRRDARALVRAPGQASDADSIFLSFVLHHFPPGLVGLLLAVIICAALSATASALNALGATSVVDFYRLGNPTPPTQSACGPRGLRRWVGGSSPCPLPPLPRCSTTSSRRSTSSAPSSTAPCSACSSPAGCCHACAAPPPSPPPSARRPAWWRSGSEPAWATSGTTSRDVLSCWWSRCSCRPHWNTGARLAFHRPPPDRRRGIQT